MKKLFIFIIFSALFAPEMLACTGIMLRTQNGHPITARTIEWANEPLSMMYVVVPRGHKHKSILPDGTTKGLRYQAQYGYVGIAISDELFIMEGLNEQGLSAGLFYFPDYGEYPSYDDSKKDVTLSDMQFVSWVLASFATIDEVIANLPTVRIVNIDPRASTTHWRITEASGRQIVIEIIGQKINIHENPLGVLTNSPSFDWHLTNLNNYVNLKAGSVLQRGIGKLSLKAFGGGSGLHGLPGDMTPTSRFVRAAFLQTTAPVFESSEQTVIQAFHILNNFDIPIGIQYGDPDLVPNMHSATQVTIATDLINRRIYFRTMYNSHIRCLNLKTIDFEKIKYQSEFLEISTTEPIQFIEFY
jgi:choloylglycine hydrolase